MKYSVHMSERSFRPTKFGWMKYLIRKTTPKWCSVSVGDYIGVKSNSSSDDLVVQVEEVLQTNEINEIINSENYLQVCPWACSIAMAKQALSISLFGINEVPIPLPCSLILIKFIVVNTEWSNKPSLPKSLELTKSIL